MCSLAEFVFHGPSLAHLSDLSHSPHYYTLHMGLLCSFSHLRSTSINAPLESSLLSFSMTSRSSCLTLSFKPRRNHSVVLMLPRSWSNVGVFVPACYGENHIRHCLVSKYMHDIVRIMQVCYLWHSAVLYKHC